MFNLPIPELQTFHKGHLDAAETLVLKTKEANRDFNEDELKTYNDHIAQANRAIARIEFLTKHEAAKAKVQETTRQVPPSKEREVPGVVTREGEITREQAQVKALQLWMRRGNYTQEDLHIFQSAGVDPNSREFSIDLNRRSTITKSTSNVTAATVPPSFLAQFEESLKAFTPIRPEATVITTATGEVLTLPSFSDYSNVGAIVAEDGDAFAADANPSFDTMSLSAYKYYSKRVPISFELLNDSIYNFESELPRLFGERIGRIQNQHFTTGDGSSKPYGIVTGATASGITATVSGVSFDNLQELPFAVDRAYRQQGKYMMNDNTILYIKKLKDGVNRYYFDPETGIVTICGYPVVANLDMADIGASAKSILFGDFTKYHIRDVGQLRVRRLDEIEAQYDRVVFVAFLRSDAKLRDAGAHPVKYLVHAAS